MQSLSKFNKGIRFSLCVIDIFSKCVWVGPVKGKKCVIVVNAFQKVLDDSMEWHSKRNPNKIWVDKGIEFYNSSFKKWLKDNNVKIYSTCSKGKFVIAERFIRNLKNKIYKCMTLILKHVYIEKLDDIVNEYNNTYHSRIKMKPFDAKSGNCIEYNVYSNDKDPKFEIGDHVRISKYKNIFAKGYTPNWSEEISVIKNVENTVPWTNAINE